MGRHAEAANDQMEESLVMGHAGLYSEDDYWSGVALLRVNGRASGDCVLRLTDQIDLAA